MITVLKNIVSFILPVTVVVLVPRWIENNWSIQMGPHLFFGMVLMIAGLAVMVVTIASFIRIGKGTLAPWTPPKKLVIKGLYRYVRNPMIMGVITVLLGEALVFRSINILNWAGAFFVINMIYFVLLEEPMLEDRFGQDYVEYKKHVPRWIPRLKAYSPKKNGQ